MKKDELRHWLHYALSYAEYRNLTESLLSEGKTTGLTQTDEYLEATRINQQRMNRLDKTAEISKPMAEVLAALNRPLLFLTISEAWCGDAAQNLPWIHLIATSSGGKIQDYYILRDDHPDLMNQFLTNGSKSIPKLLIMDPKTGELFATWGPRPEAIQDWFIPIRKAVSTAEEKSDSYTQLHTRYSQDKGHELQADLIQLLKPLAL